MTNSPLAGASARPPAAACPKQTAASIICAAKVLLGHLPAGRRIDASAVRTAMQSAFGASDGLQLRRSRLMQVNRIDLTGFAPTAIDRLKAMGLFFEIVSWKLRLFVPDDAVTGSAALERLFERHPLVRIADRKAA